MAAPATPVLSVVIGIVSDTLTPEANVDLLAVCLNALARQVDAPHTEIIVPHHEHVIGIEALKEEFPQVRFLTVSGPECTPAAGGGREHHDSLRARGIAAARGEIVALLEDHGRPDDHWSANVVKAHQSNHAAVGGAIENEVDRALNWAVYFCDFGRYQNPVPTGITEFASDANVSYKRAALESIRETWEESYREVVVNGALKSQGASVVLDPSVVVFQQRSGLRLVGALRERFIWGHSYALTRSLFLSHGKRLFYAALSPALPFLLVQRMAGTSWKRRRRFGWFLKSLPLISALQVSWSLGEGLGYLNAIARSCDTVVPPPPSGRRLQARATFPRSRNPI